MTSQSPGMVVLTADNPHPHPRTDNGEQVFADFLNRLGWLYEWESVTFHGLPPIVKGGADRAFTPDIKLVSIPGRSLAEPVYLELTEADRHSIRRKHVISPEEYLARKSTKISHAVRIHHIRVILIPYALQLRIFADPDILLALVDEAAQADPARLRLVV